MHILNRVITMLVLGLVLIPAGTYALLSFDEQQETRQDLTIAIGRAAQRYQQRGGTQAVRGRAEQEREQHASRLAALTKRKRELRDTILALRSRVKRAEAMHGAPLDSVAAIDAAIVAQKAVLSELAVQSFRQERSGEAATGDVPELRTAVARGAGKEAEDEAERTRLASARADLIDDLRDVREAFNRRQALTAERETVLREYREVSNAYGAADEIVRKSEVLLAEIKAIMADVHRDVLSLQGELARIDAQLRRKAERSLLEKGLLSPEEIERSAKASAAAFIWPAYGPISAGFLEESYEGRFGVPHHGMDIVIDQGTPVASASDGVVFLVRDGGATGYTYVLIGHRDGYATLYGHLSAVSATAGQHVRAGEVIGLSGGRPGTRGAGPMTTAPHLHFEVIQRGVNVDPKSVLP